MAALVAPVEAQQDSFRWMDFSNPKDQDIVVWVNRSMATEKWSAIREIGVVYDAALVVTTLRANPQASPGADTFSLWSVSLTNRTQPTPLLKGVNLRWLDWMQFSDSGAPEIAALYEDCNECAATTYFTALHYDMSQHLWTPRWLRGGQTAPVWSSTTPAGVDVTRVYAVLAEPNGRVAMGTWTHFDYGKQKPAEDFIYRYDIDPFNGLDRMQLVSGKEAEIVKQRLCGVPATGLGTARGQDSALCQQTVHPRWERRPVTTPPANNQGRSVPPGTKRQK
jgi:hypothetical protein